MINSLEQLKRQLQHCSQTTGRMLYMGKRHVRLEKTAAKSMMSSGTLRVYLVSN